MNENSKRNAQSWECGHTCFIAPAFPRKFPLCNIIITRLPWFMGRTFRSHESRQRRNREVKGSREIRCVNRFDCCGAENSLLHLVAARTIEAEPRAHEAYYRWSIFQQRRRVPASSENDYARGDRVCRSAASKVSPTLLNLDSHASNFRDPS